MTNQNYARKLSVILYRTSSNTDITDTFTRIYGAATTL